MTMSKDQLIEEHMREVLRLIGMDMTEVGIQDTPKRFRKYLQEFMQPIDIDKVIGNGFDRGKYDNLVAQANIPFRMACEHHLLPALGTASVGYIPSDRVIGLSKLARLVQAVGTERPSLQESICDRIADLLEKHLNPKGTIVVIQAEHSCMACRGVNSPGVITSTSSVRGIFMQVPQARAEFFELIKSSKPRH